MMSDTQVIVVSLAVGFGVGIALLMVLWACKACLGKPKTADDDNAATEEAARVRQQRAATAEAAVTAQQVNVQLPAGPERPARDPSVCDRFVSYVPSLHLCVHRLALQYMTCLMLTRANVVC